MTIYSSRRSILLGALVTFLHTGVGVPMTPAFAQELETDGIVRALRRRRKRGQISDENGPEYQTVERLRQVRRRRGLNLQERGALYEATRNMPQVEMEIFFAFDSSTVAPEAMRALDKLGAALRDSDLRLDRFIIAGHTDGKGSAEYNHALSERRAMAVATYLTNKFRLASDSLLTVGYGFERPKNATDPLAGENRRVQVVNAGR
jgi:outer membrane protein OmpA-like peptidoglycan-associated protein